jgi:transposase
MAKKARSAQKEADTEHDRMVVQHRSLANQRGRTLTAGENRTVLALLLALQLHEGKKHTEAVETVASWLGSSTKTIAAVWHRWQEEGSVPQPLEQHRGAAAQSHPWRRSLLNAEQTATLQLALYSAQHKGKHCSSSLLKKQSDHGLVVSSRTVRRWLNKLGYRWGRSRCIGTMTKAARAKRVRAFLREYAAALK